MPKKEETKEPEAKAEEKPEAPKEPTQEQIQAQVAKAEEQKAAKAMSEQEKIRKVVIGNMSFAAGLATAHRACKEAGLTNPDTDVKMKVVVDEIVRTTFNWPPIQPIQPPVAPTLPPAQAPPGYTPPVQPPGQPAVPARTYPGQPPAR